MLTSVEKVRQLAEHADQLEVSGTAAVLKPLLSLALPNLLGMLPSDPAELDAQLGQLGDFIHTLRSDPGSLPDAS